MGQSVKQIRQPTTVNDHIRELLLRLLVSFIVMIVAGSVIFLFYAPILAFLGSPLGAPLYYNNPAGSFNFIMKICFTGALIFAIPVLVFNLIMFIRPAFEKELSMKRILITTGLSTILAISGAVFAFYCILPGTLKFFSDFQVSGLKALISADSYLSFVTNIIVMFVIVFQIPLVIMFIDRIKPIKPKKLIKMEKWVVVGSLVVALLAPFTYDLLTSLLMAVPIVVLYNLSIVIVVARHAMVARNERRVIHAVVADQIMDISDISVSDLAYETIAEELSGLEKTASPKPISSFSLDSTYLDIKPQHIQTEAVQPAPWVEERKARRLALNAQVRVFSDIRRRPNPNRALA